MLYADQVIIGGQPSKDAIGGLLYTSGVGKHTSIVYLGKRADDDGKVVVSVTQYVWEHKFQRPNTFSYPITCPTCHHVYSWQNIHARVMEDGSSFTLMCKTKLDNGQKCTGTWKIPARPNSSAVEAPYIGTWRAI